MPIDDPTPALVRHWVPKQDEPTWQDMEHLLPRPDWLRRRPGDDAADVIGPSAPKPTPLAGAAEHPTEFRADCAAAPLSSVQRPLAPEFATSSVLSERMAQRSPCCPGGKAQIEAERPL